MDKQALIDAVRTLFLCGEIDAVNAYYRLECILSAAEVSEKLREWEQVVVLARELLGRTWGGDGAALFARFFAGWTPGDFVCAVVHDINSGQAGPVTVLAHVHAQRYEGDGLGEDSDIVRACDSWAGQQVNGRLFGPVAD